MTPMSNPIYSYTSKHSSLRRKRLDRAVSRALRACRVSYLGDMQASHRQHADGVSARGRWTSNISLRKVRGVVTHDAIVASRVAAINAAVHSTRSVVRTP